MPALGLHKPHAPQSWVTLTDTPDLAPSSSLCELSGGPFLPTYSSGSAGLFLNHLHFPVTDARGSGVHQASLAALAARKLQEPNGIQFVFLFLNLFYVPILIFSSSFNSFPEQSVAKQTSHNINNSHQAKPYYVPTTWQGVGETEDMGVDTPMLRISGLETHFCHSTECDTRQAPLTPPLSLTFVTCTLGMMTQTPGLLGGSHETTLEGPA